MDIGLITAFVGGVLALLSPCAALLMPAFFVVLLVLAGRALTLPGAGEGVRFLLGRAKVLVEPSGAAALAAMLFRKIEDPPGTVGVILTGGNADFDVLARILRREI